VKSLSLTSLKLRILLRNRWKSECLSERRSMWRLKTRRKSSLSRMLKKRLKFLSQLRLVYLEHSLTLKTINPLNYHQLTTFTHSLLWLTSVLHANLLLISHLIINAASTRQLRSPLNPCIIQLIHNAKELFYQQLGTKAFQAVMDYSHPCMRLHLASNIWYIKLWVMSEDSKVP